MKILAKRIRTAVWVPVEGYPEPKKFIFYDENKEKHIIIVDHYTTEEIRTAGIKAILYRCQGTDNDVIKLFELKYLVDEYKFQLYKI
jgi:hypothetical protein